MNVDHKESAYRSITLHGFILHILTLKCVTWIVGQVMNPHPRSGQRPGGRACVKGSSNRSNHLEFWESLPQFLRNLEKIGRFDQTLSSQQNWRCAFVFYTTKAAGDDACKVGVSGVSYPESQRGTKINTLINNMSFTVAASRATTSGSKVLDNQYKIRSDATQPIVVRWSKDSDVVGWMNEWMILHVSSCSFFLFTRPSYPQ